MYSRGLRVSILFLSLSILAGCNRPNSSRPFYSLTVINSSGDSGILFPKVQWGRQPISFGRSELGGISGHGMLTSMPPKTATVSWSDEAGRPFTVEVDVPDAPNGSLYDLDYYFVLLPNHKVIVDVFTQDDIESGKHFRLAANGQPLYFVGVQAVDEVLSDVQLSLGEYVALERLQDISPENVVTTNYGWAFQAFIPYPMTEQAQLKWTTPDGMQHKQAIEIGRLQPNELEGQCVGFSIHADGHVDVTVKPWSERLKWQAE